jgi:NAD(P)-dependent dehydrogenase (short-subunit alcohol dehydrogenase family)
MMKIVVTGSSTGIGRALAQRLIGKGHSVWGLARSDQPQFTAGSNGTFRAAKCDVANWQEVERVFGEIGATWEHVDGLVCCAGSHGAVGPAVQADPAHWSATVRANLEGTFNSIRACYGLLAGAQRRAKIVCFAGGGATKARANFSGYGVAKTGIVRLVETIAEEEVQTPLDINAVAPGAIATRLTDEIIALGAVVAGKAEYDSAVKQRAGGGASLDNALDLVEWLLSEKSDGISGKLLSAPWDPWRGLSEHVDSLAKSDVYTLRRILPEDRGMKF